MHPSYEFQAKTAAGSVGYADKPRDLSPMEQAMNSNTNVIHEMAACLDQLEQRLQPVLRPVPPQTESKSLNAVDVAHSMAVDQLHIQRRQIEVVINRVNDLLSRVET